MKNVNLLIDGKFLNMRTLNTLGRSGTKHTPLLSTQSDRDAFFKRMVLDLSFATKVFQSLPLGDVVFCIESGSWRKTDSVYSKRLKSMLVELKKEVSNTGDIKEENEIHEEIYNVEKSLYKANREKSGKVDWQSFETMCEELYTVLEKYGLNPKRLPKMEGDDLITLYTEYYLNRGESVIIITNDGDIKQLVCQHGESFVGCYSPLSKVKKLSLPTGFEYNESGYVESDDPLGFIDMGVEDMYKEKEVMETMFKQEGITVEYIDPVEICFKKIIGGDMSDNIPNVLKGYGKKSVEKLWIRVKSEMEINTINDLIYNEDLISLCSFELGITKASKRQSMTQAKIESRIKENMELVILHPSVIPKSVKSYFDDTFANTKAFNIDFWNRRLIDGDLGTNSSSFAPSNAKPFNNIDSVLKLLDDDE